jgi:hypothetical protein
MPRFVSACVVGSVCALLAPVSARAQGDMAKPAPPHAPEPPSPAAPATKDAEITNNARIAVVLYPTHRADNGLVNAPEAVTLKPGQSVSLKVRADWDGTLGIVEFLPEFAVRGGSAFPYGFVAFTPANLSAQITDDSIPDPDRDTRREPARTPELNPPAAAPVKPLVPWPHPLITEVLYAVPTGAAGDANKDGERTTNGDEFVELANPHDRPINLRGYTISGKAPAGAASTRKFTVLKFTFPSCELAPGEVAVVFNGHGAKWSGPVGDTTHAAAGNAAFANARIFTMNVESSRLGFANKADYVLLSAPSGEPVHCVKWGDLKPPEKTALVEAAPEVSRQSVFRRTASAPLEPHPSIGGVRFSPGRFPLDQKVVEAPAATPPRSSETPKPPAKPSKKSPRGGPPR